MSAVLDARGELRRAVEPMGHYFLRPVRLFRRYDRSHFRADFVAGLTTGVIMLPQAIAFALIAELPPEMGIYAAIVGSIVGALWGSSDQVHNGPTNANSLLILSALLSASFVPGTSGFVVAAGLMAVMAGVFQLVLGLARLGVLVNFVSYSVIVGFSAGAGILIAVKQIEPLLGVEFANSDMFGVAVGLMNNLDAIHAPTAVIGLGSIALLVLLPRLSPRLPAALLTMVVASLVVALLGLREAGVGVIGELPQGLPPLASLPVFNLDVIGRLSTGALAVGAIGLVQTIAMARTIAVLTGQRVDSNQEFVGQGLANIAAGFLSGFPIAGSFSRSAVNVQAGARSPIAAIISGVFVLLAALVLAPLAVFLPRAALAGVLVIIAYGLVDRTEIARIAAGTRGDALIMIITLIGTVFLPIEFAVLLGILLSFVHYTLRTSMPRVHQVLPDDNFRRFRHQPEKENCPQLSIIDILGDLYFGAVNHVEEEILKHLSRHPEQRFLLIRMNHVNHCDYSGIHMLENLVRAYRDAGGDVFMVRVGPRAMKMMKSTNFLSYLGKDNLLDDDEAISYIFHHVLDPAVCIYECPVRAFRECQNLPKRIDFVDIPPFKDIPLDTIVNVKPRELWQRLHRERGNGKRPLVVDVREPREFRQGHIPDAQLVPLSTILADTVKLPNDRQVVLVCRSGRRSQRAAYALHKMGCVNVGVLRGGMLAWESADLLEAVEEPRPEGGIAE
ncbi:MAG: SulP family inorganic anion transporter [Chloroflexota bacterium]